MKHQHTSSIEGAAAAARLIVALVALIVHTIAATVRFIQR